MADSLVTPVTSTAGSGDIERDTHIRQRRPESTNAAFMREKLRALRGTVSEISTNGNANNDENAAAEAPTSLDDGMEYRRGLRHETDGGVRLAGGRVGEPEVAANNIDQHSAWDGSTLPLPYSSHFGEWCVCLTRFCSVRGLRLTFIQTSYSPTRSLSLSASVHARGVHAESTWGGLPSVKA